MEKLKPCPFCGNDNIILQYDNGKWFIDCKKCKFSLSNDYKYKLLKTWNRRVK